jgi:hypothetical protein
MTFTYRSGEEIRKGDRVTFHGQAGEVEHVADPQSKNLSEAERWHVEDCGGGIMVREPKVFGRVFLSADGIPGEEGLVFVARASDETNRSPQNG